MNLRALTEEEVKVIKEFGRMMGEEVIPEIIRVLQEREEIWQKKFNASRLLSAF